MKIRTLKDLATAINAMGTGHKAVTGPSWTSTDQRLADCRHIARPGKGRKGVKITVTNPEGDVVLTCDTSRATPVTTAISEAVRQFGSRLDTDSGELFEVGSCVWVFGRYMLLYGIVVSVKMRS